MTETELCILAAQLFDHKGQNMWLCHKSDCGPFETALNIISRKAQEGLDERNKHNSELREHKPSPSHLQHCQASFSKMENCHI